MQQPGVSFAPEAGLILHSLSRVSNSLPIPAEMLVHDEQGECFQHYPRQKINKKTGLTGLFVEFVNRFSAERLIRMTFGEYGLAVYKWEPYGKKESRA